MLRTRLFTYKALAAIEGVPVGGGIYLEPFYKIKALLLNCIDVGKSNLKIMIWQASSRSAEPYRKVRSF
jgi:hypothetical protein